MSSPFRLNWAESRHRLKTAGRPCAAIAAYHPPDDLLALPARMDRPDWKIAFAHYSQSFGDSIFYFWR